MTPSLRDPLRAGLVVALALAQPTLTRATDGVTNRASVRTGGAQANGPSEAAVITPDGTWVAFASDATNLVAGDTNGFMDVFVRNRFLGQTVRVSVGPRGAQGNNDSGPRGAEYGRPIDITPDGRLVVFNSKADNLAGADINVGADIYLRDRDPDADGVFDEINALTELISVKSDGAQPLQTYSCYCPAISDSGRFVAFQSTGRLVAALPGVYSQIFLRDRTAGTTSMVSINLAGSTGLGNSSSPAISGNSRYVAFASEASDLVMGDTGGHRDIFVRDLLTSITTRVSIRTGGTQANGDSNFPRISYDGRWVVFQSSATNLVSGDANGFDDVFLHDRATGTTSLVSRDLGGSSAADPSRHPDISPNGRWIVFDSNAHDLTAEDPGYYSHIFRFDRQTGAMRWLTRPRVGWALDFATGNSYWPSVDGSGNRTAFDSYAYSLIFGDSNETFDIFVRTVMPMWIPPKY